jgi:hypothetical protein
VHAKETSQGQSKNDESTSWKVPRAQIGLEDIQVLSSQYIEALLKNEHIIESSEVSCLNSGAKLSLKSTLTHFVNLKNNLQKDQADFKQCKSCWNKV